MERIQQVPPRYIPPGKRLENLSLSQHHSAKPDHQPRATIIPATTFLRFQTVQEAINKIGHIGEEDYEEGFEPLPHQQFAMCLQCFKEIDPDTCKMLDSGWGVGWCCGYCGYLKNSQEMTTTFLMGAEKRRNLKPQEIPQYCVRVFPWVKNHPEAIIDQLTMQVACVSRRGGQSLRQTLGDADFFGYSGVFDALARSLFELREYEIDAVRLQGIILLRHDKNTKKNQIDRNKVKEKKKSAISTRRKDADGKVMHFQCASSKLISDGRSHSLAVLVEHSLDSEGEPIVNSYLDHARVLKEHNGPTPSKQTLGVLGQVLRMKLTGINRKEELREERTLAQMQEITDGNLEQLMWQYLSVQLSMIQEALPNDGDCVLINLNQRNARNRDSVPVIRKGSINPASLRDDFRSTFRL